MENDKVIALGMFRMNTLQNSRVDKVVANKLVKASVKPKLIPVSQPYVINKQYVNSNSNGLSFIGVESTTKTRRPQPKSNTKNDSASKSSCIKNKEVELEEHHRNLLLSKNQKHMSSECNNIKLAIRNDKSEVICAMWSKDRLASPRPRKPRTCLRWSPTGRIFDLSEKLILSSDFECQSDISEGYPNLFMVRRLGLFQAYDRESEAAHQLRLEVSGNCSLINDHIAAILGYGDLQ
ncbi:hypothetical protein Tco_0569696 [Tanacetum coccineum]